MTLRPATPADIPDLFRFRFAVPENRLADPATVWLSTDPNTRAHRFYERAGWQPTGVQPIGELRFEMSRQRWLTRSPP